MKPVKSVKQVKTVKNNTEQHVNTHNLTNVPKNTKTMILSPKSGKRKIEELTMADFTNNRYKLDDQSYIEYYPNFVQDTDAVLIELIGSADLTYDQSKLPDAVPWKQGIYNMFGKPVPTPRLLYAMRDADQDISCVYKITGSAVWSDQIKKLRDAVAAKTGRSFRYAQMNLYRNGVDYIGFHTDSEVAPNDIIASVSIGTTREFRLISADFKNNDLPMYSIKLEPGSLIIMNEYAAKHNWKHEIVQDPKIKELRLNITFRPN